MRRIVSAIAVLLVFFSLQYGKVAEYLYCEAQAKLVLQQATDCGCEHYLIAMFGEDGSDGFAASPIKEKPAEFFTAIVTITNELNHCIPSTDHIIQSSGVLNQFPEPAFHPPA